MLPSPSSSSRRLLTALVIAVGLALLASSAKTEGGAKLAKGMQRCASCHSMDPALSHPLTVAESGLLPLGPGGLMDCTTCHAPVFEGQLHLEGRGGGELLLPGRELCASCHSAADVRSNLGHALLTGQAHLGSVPEGGSGLDRESRSCLGCHDGATASLPSVREGGSLGGFDGAASSQHPVAVRMPMTGRGLSNYRSTAAIDPAVRIFDGRLGCGSCHSVYGGQDHQLVMSNRGSRLCLSCHIK